MTEQPVIGRATRPGASNAQGAAAPSVPRRLALRAAPLAWSLAAVSSTLSLIGLGLLWHNDVGWLQAHPDDAVNGIIYPIVGALILSRHRRHRIGWLFVAIGLPMATSILATQYALAGFPGAVMAEWTGRWVWLLGVPLIPTVVVLLFPDGRLPSRRWRPVLWAGITGIALLLPAIALLPEQDPTAAANPLTVAAFEGPLSVVAVAGFVLLGIGSLGALGSVAVRYRSADRTGRLQLRWFVTAAAAVVFAVVLGNFVPVVGPIVQLVAFPLVAFATAAAILRHRLYGIDSVISTSLLWGGLTACVLGAYVALTALVGGLFPREPGMWPALVATAVVAVAFQPLRVRLQAGVDRLVYGDRTDPGRGLRRLGARLENTLAIGAVLPTVVETVAEALRARAVAGRAVPRRPVGAWRLSRHSGRLATATAAVVQWRARGALAGLSPGAWRAVHLRGSPAAGRPRPAGRRRGPRGAGHHGAATLSRTARERSRRRTAAHPPGPA
jgi:hypothetical protein